MKNKTGERKAAITLMIWQGMANPAFAAGAREDNSSIFVWIFLALCALIIVGQLIPAFLVLTGFAKGLKKETPKETVAAAAENEEP
jgi:hypothetical protein